MSEPNVETLLLGLLSMAGRPGLPGWAEVDAELRRRVAAIELDRSLTKMLARNRDRLEMALFYGSTEPAVFSGLDWSAS